MPFEPAETGACRNLKRKQMLLILSLIASGSGGVHVRTSDQVGKLRSLHNRVALVILQLSWVDLDWESSPCWFVTMYCYEEDGVTSESSSPNCQTTRTTLSLKHFFGHCSYVNVVTSLVLEKAMN